VLEEQYVVITEERAVKTIEEGRRQMNEKGRE